MARVVWRGAIVFGLVNVPVDLYPGAKDNDLDFDWIDKRDMAPVGYQRINKSTGKPVEMKEIVKGYQYEKGSYVVLEDEDFKAANPKATQSVEILSFVDREAILPQFFEKPYRLIPGKRGEKGYALLRETLKKTNKVGIAQVVIRAKQHLAALMPIGDMLELITMRYAEEVLDEEDFDFPSLRDAKVTDKEVELAKRLVDDMTEKWEPKRYHDTYRDDLMKRIETLATQGRTTALRQADKEARESGGAQIIDLMAALKRSLDRKDDGPARGRANAREESLRPAAKKRASAKSRAKSVKSSAKTASRKRA
ncbi:MAG TPA: Ku protein [Casimicrobiaceae bacterium]|nr:Ku protein [Casimicrobiaceae bacterium]